MKISYSKSIQRCDRERIQQGLAHLQQTQVIQRIWDRDYTVWKPTATGITNRLGWLDIMDQMMPQIASLMAFSEEIRAEGYTHIELLGMGGSSLASDVLRKMLPSPDGYPTLSILDSTDPEAVRDHALGADPRKTLYIVSTKSGTTSETLSFFKYFYNLALTVMPSEEVGHHFIAITDPGSKLADLAGELHFKRTFLNEPTVGGRFSVLSYFGLVPAVLMGVDIKELLQRAQKMARQCREGATDTCNIGATLGVVIAKYAQCGRDKLTFVASPTLMPFGDWVEQLVAESTGKEGKGILPVVGELLGSPDVYGNDRLFIKQALAGEDVPSDWSDAIVAAGQPMVTLELSDVYDVGALFFVWAMATAVVGHVLQIQPFDQPDVEAAKIQARKFIDQYRSAGRLDPVEYAVLSAESVSSFLGNAKPGAYIALQAYTRPSDVMDESLSKLRAALRERTGLAVTTGYGPRFLHSTGQLHKGDQGRGLFIQLLTEPDLDIAIPDNAGEATSSLSFQVLKVAQALGDYQALKDAGRCVIRFKLGAYAPSEVEDIVRIVQAG